MVFEDFEKIENAEEKKAIYDSLYESADQIGDKDVEIASLKSELEGLKATSEKLTSELAQTKEVNYTLARKVSAAPKKSVEELLHTALERR